MLLLDVDISIQIAPITFFVHVMLNVASMLLISVVFFLFTLFFLSLFDDESQSVVRVVRISIENGTFGGAAAEKPVNRLTQNLALVIIYVGDATQYPKWHVNRFEELPPRRDEMLMVSAFYFVCALLQLGVNRWTDFDE